MFGLEDLCAAVCPIHMSQKHLWADDKELFTDSKWLKTFAITYVPRTVWPRKQILFSSDHTGAILSVYVHNKVQRTQTGALEGCSILSHSFNAQKKKKNKTQLWESLLKLHSLLTPSNTNACFYFCSDSMTERDNNRQGKGHSHRDKNSSLCKVQQLT